MFTGIVEGRGRVARIRGSSTRGAMTLELQVGRKFAGLKRGASLAVGGVCLTVTRSRGRRLSFDIVRETLCRTTLEALRPDDRVNLERALRWRGRVEGHFVFGHVDGTGRVRRVIVRGAQRDLLIGMPASMTRWVKPKASVAVDGVSLTIGRVGKGGFWIHLVPHTLRVTTLGALKASDRVNLEADRH